LEADLAEIAAFTNSAEHPVSEGARVELFFSNGEWMEADLGQSIRWVELWVSCAWI
jgi:hypothetical protein